MGEQRSRCGRSSPTPRAMSLISYSARRASALRFRRGATGIGRLPVFILAIGAATAGACFPSRYVTIPSGPACDTVSTLRSGPRPAIPTVGEPLAGRASLVGIIVDSQTGIGISQAVLRLDGVNLVEIVSERDGSFIIANTEPGRRAVRVLRIGYESSRDSVALHANRVDSVVIQLKYYACR